MNSRSLSSSNFPNISWPCNCISLVFTCLPQHSLYSPLTLIESVRVVILLYLSQPSINMPHSPSGISISRHGLYSFLDKLQPPVRTYLCGVVVSPPLTCRLWVTNMWISINLMASDRVPFSVLYIQSVTSHGTETDCAMYTIH